MGLSPVGVEVGGFPARALLPNRSQAGWVGGDTSLSQGVKTLSPFLEASDGLIPLPGIGTRTVPLPSLGSGVGGLGLHTHPPSSFLGRI